MKSKVRKRGNKTAILRLTKAEKQGFMWPRVVTMSFRKGSASLTARRKMGKRV